MCGILAIYNKDKHLNNNIRSMSLDIIKKVTETLFIIYIIQCIIMNI